MAKQTPRERRSARTRQEILAAALALINEAGTTDFSLREVARQVNYSPAGLYEYFGSKDEILGALVIEGDRRLRAAMSAVSDTLPPDDYLVELLLAYIQFARQNPEHFMLMFALRAPAPPDAYAIMEEEEDTYNLLARAVQAALDAGLIAVGEGQGLHQVTYSLWAAAHGMATLQVTRLRDIDLGYPPTDRRALQAMVRGLAAQP